MVLTSVSNRFTFALEGRTMTLPRVMPPTEVSQEVDVEKLVLELPRNVERIHSLVVAPGEKEHGRVTTALAFWQRGVGRHLFVANDHTLENLKEEFGLTRLEGVVVGR